MQSVNSILLLAFCGRCLAVGAPDKADTQVHHVAGRHSHLRQSMTGTSAISHGRSLDHVRHHTEAKWSEKKQLKDPYAPEPPGAATVDDWCNQPKIYDPACMANPVAMSMEEEIDAVMLHMMCRLKKQHCKDGPESAGSDAKASPSSPRMTPSPPDAGKSKADPVAALPPSVVKEAPATTPTPATAEAAAGSEATTEAPAKQHREGTTPLNNEAEEAAEDISVLVNKMDDIKTELNNEGKLDPELRRATDGIVESGKDTVAVMESMSTMSDHEASNELDVAVHEAENLDAAVFKFETEVHPHGYKWWRFRWEYAFVEAVALMMLVFVAMLLYLLIHRASTAMHDLTPSVNLPGTSVANLYGKLFQCMLFEFSVLGAIAFIIWALEECGLFMHMVAFNPIKSVIEFHKGDGMHWPTTDRHFIYTLRTVNVHFFLGMLLYMILMYHVSHGAMCVLEQFMRHESPDFYARLLESGGESSDFVGKAPELRYKGDVLANFFRNKGPLGRILSSDLTMRIVVGHFDVDKDYKHLKHCVAAELQKPLGSLHTVLPEIPIYPYIAMKLHRALEAMIVIDWRVWLLTEVVLVGQACVHYFLHQAVVELLPFTIAFGCLILGCQFVWTRRRASYVLDKRNHFEKGVAEPEGIPWETWVLLAQQLNFFFLCFSAARLVFSSFFWTDYFWLSCAVFALFLGLYLTFVIIGSLTVPMFIIMLSLRRVTEQDVLDMKEILEEQEQDGSPRKDSMMGSMGSMETTDKKKRLRHCATTLAVV